MKLFVMFYLVKWLSMRKETFKDRKDIIPYSKKLQKEIYHKIYPKYFEKTLDEKDLSDIKYTGVDIVPSIIDSNNNKFGNNNFQFKVMDAVE